MSPWLLQHSSSEQRGVTMLNTNRMQSGRCAKALQFASKSGEGWKLMLFTLPQNDIWVCETQSRLGGNCLFKRIHLIIYTSKYTPTQTISTYISRLWSPDCESWVMSVLNLLLQDLGGAPSLGGKFASNASMQCVQGWGNSRRQIDQ